MQLGTNFVLANPAELKGVAENYRPERILTMERILFNGGEEEGAILLANFLGLCPEERLPSGQEACPKYLGEIRAFHEGRLARGEMPDGSAARGDLANPRARSCYLRPRPMPRFPEGKGKKIESA